MMALAIVIVCLSFVLAVGCLTADKLFPRLRAVERFVGRLPLGGDERW